MQGEQTPNHQLETKNIPQMRTPLLLQMIPETTPEECLDLDIFDESQIPVPRTPDTEWVIDLRVPPPAPRKRVRFDEENTSVNKKQRTEEDDISTVSSGETFTDEELEELLSLVSEDKHCE